jgi:hypothetical protein
MTGSVTTMRPVIIIILAILFTSQSYMYKRRLITNTPLFVQPQQTGSQDTNKWRKMFSCCEHFLQHMLLMCQHTKA